MLSVLLILPDFLVILVGFLLMKFFHDGVFNETFWKGAEKIVFYVLFPPLLFTSVATSNLTLGEAGLYLVVAISAMMCAVVMSYLIRYFVKADPVTHASAFHCGFRFCCVLFTDTNIFHDGVIKQHNILKNDREVFHQHG